MTITDVWPIDTCDECKGSGKCQYSEAVSMPEYRCVGVCQYAALAVEGPASFAMADAALRAISGDTSK